MLLGKGLGARCRRMLGLDCQARQSRRAMHGSQCRRSLKGSSQKYVLLRRKDNALHLVQHFVGGTTAKVGA